MSIAKKYFLNLRLRAELEERRAEILRLLSRAYESSKKISQSVEGSYNGRVLTINYELIRVNDSSFVAVQQLYTPPDSLVLEDFQDFFDDFLVETFSLRPSAFLTQTGLLNFVFTDLAAFKVTEPIVVSSTDDLTYRIIHDELIQKLTAIEISSQKSLINQVLQWKRSLDRANWNLETISISDVAVDPEFPVYFTKLDEKISSVPIEDLIDSIRPEIKIPSDLILSSVVDYAATLHAVEELRVKIPERFAPQVSLSLLAAGTEAEVSAEVQFFADDLVYDRERALELHTKVSANLLPIRKRQRLGPNS